MASSLGRFALMLLYLLVCSFGTWIMRAGVYVTAFPLSIRD